MPKITVSSLSTGPNFRGEIDDPKVMLKLFDWGSTFLEKFKKKTGLKKEIELVRVDPLQADGKSVMVTVILKVSLLGKLLGWYEKKGGEKEVESMTLEMGFHNEDALHHKEKTTSEAANKLAKDFKAHAFTRMRQWRDLVGTEEK